MIYQGIRIKNKLPKNTKTIGEELESAKESKKPELGKHCKLFFITAQIKLRCEPNATREDAYNALKEIVYESHGEDLQIDRVIGG